MGGIHSKQLYDLCFIVWIWCIKRDIVFSVQYLPVVKIYMLKHFLELSLILQNRYKKICKKILLSRCRSLSFSYLLTNWINLFSGIFPFPNAYHVDAFTLAWLNLSRYIFQPFTLFVRIIKNHTY